MALARAVCASSASLTASLFSFLPISRISVASFMCAVILPTISSAALTSSLSFAARAWSSSILRVSSSIFSPLSLIEDSVLLISKSHHCLCSFSSFCSFMSRKIIFWMELMTWSKAPSPCFTRSVTSSARRSSALECAALASWRRMRKACSALGLPSCSRATGDGGGTGLPGGEIRTPVTLARMEIAVSMASLSLARVEDRSSHSLFFVDQALSVSDNDFESAAKSSLVLLCAASAAMRSSSEDAISSALVFLESFLALMRLPRASFASSEAFIAFVSASSVAMSSSWNLSERPLRSSITVSDLKA
mmetsp:Transcript_87558/g.282968  ORF Transcript_87558/g.282968 Transcript_87558/m.282968 type:complete len:306 (+) Transcript_87558:795-1712(+)